MPIKVLTPVWVSELWNLPLRIGAIVLGSILLMVLVHFLVNRLSRSIVFGTNALAKRITQGDDEEAAKQLAALSARRHQRAKTTSAVFKSVADLTIFVIALLTILDLVGINIAPILASAGIVGVAVGFGAQSLVKDFISGVFMLVEDQYGVGDTVDLGCAIGTVEKVGLRVTQLRDVDGVVWYVRNGEIQRVGNKTQDWSRARVKVLIPAGQDVMAASDTLTIITKQLLVDPHFGPMLFDAPTVIAYDDLSAKAVTLWVQARTLPAKQWEIAREIRRRIQVAVNNGELCLEMPPVLL